MSTAQSLSDEAFLVGAIRRALGQISLLTSDAPWHLEDDATIIQEVTDASEALESLEQILGLREKTL